jgi:hypothetical protein
MPLGKNPRGVFPNGIFFSFPKTILSATAVDINIMSNNILFYIQIIYYLISAKLSIARGSANRIVANNILYNKYNKQYFIAPKR